MPTKKINDLNKKVKSMKRLEKACLVGVASGIGVIAVGGFIEEDIMLEMLGMGITITSTVKGLSTVLKRGSYESQINQEYLKYLKNDTRDTISQNKSYTQSNTKSDDNYKTIK